MKRKHFALILGSMLAMNVYGTAFAASTGDFADLPADHWAYKAVSELARVGIIEGYDDKTFRGDKTMTRYEMSQVVEKAMDNSGKANAKQKALIDKLASEFALELNKIDTRVTNIDNRVKKLEDANKKSMKVGFDSMIAYNVDSAAAGTPTAQGPEKLISRYRLHLTTDLSETTSFWMRLGTNFVMAGGKENSTSPAAPSTYAYIDQAYFTLKNVWGLDSLRFGRQGISELGAFVVQKGQGNDGVTMEKRLNDSTTLRAGMAYIKANNSSSTTYGVNSLTNTIGEDQTFSFISWNKTFDNDSGVKVLYGNARDTQTQKAATGTIGYTGSRLTGINVYKKMGDWTASTEYVRASLGNSTDSAHPHAWSVQVTNAKAPAKRTSINFLKDPYVDLSRVGDTAFTLAYHYLGAGAQPANMGSWTNALGMSYANTVQLKDNVKGWAIDYQVVLTKGILLDLTYQSLQAANTIGAVKAGDKKLNCFSAALGTYF